MYIHLYTYKQYVIYICWNSIYLNCISYIIHTFAKRIGFNIGFILNALLSLHIFTYVCMHVCMYVYACMHVCICMYACMYMHVYACMRLSTLQCLLLFFFFSHEHRCKEYEVQVIDGLTKGRAILTHLKHADHRYMAVLDYRYK